MNRIKKLKDALFSEDDRGVFIERFRLLKQAYVNYRDKPYAIRHSLITNEILSNISVVINKDDLIVGRVKEDIPSAEDEKILDEIPELDPDSGSEVDIQQYASYPEVSNKAYSTTATHSSTPDRCNLPTPTWYSTFGHVIPDWEELLKIGMNGIKEKAKGVLEKMTGVDREAENKRQFLQGVVISCDAVVNFARRYSERLGELGQEERDHSRRAELLKMAEKREKERYEKDPICTSG